jgi:hypothetical protein
MKYTRMWLLLTLFALVNLSLGAGFDGGDGSAGDPYQLANADQLNLVRDYPTGYYFVQTADIFLNVPPYNSDPGWIPIGNQSVPFSGNFNGGGYSVHNLYINDSSGIHYGLFGYVDSAVLTDIHLTGVYVLSDNNTGGLVGTANSLTNISRCTAEGTVTYHAKKAGGGYFGGLVGFAGRDVSIEYCSFNGSVTAYQTVGGLVGCLFRDCSVRFSFSKGSVNCSGNAAGGLVGSVGSNPYSSSVRDSYSNSMILGSGNYFGGLVGILDSSIVSKCYSSGYVNWEPSYKGGLIGMSYTSTTENSYWDVNTSGQINSGGGTGLTTSEMMDSKNYDQWDFSTPVWKIVQAATYPYLEWQPSANLRFSVSPAGGGYTNAVDGEYPTGSQINLSATNYSYTSFVNWTDNYKKSVLSGNANFTYTVTGDDTDISANFYMIFAGGDGSPGNPYLVANVDQLNNVRNYLSSSFLQATDIDMSGWAWGSWVPIGNLTTPFTGDYNGADFSISNLSIHRPGEYDFGLFGQINGAQLSNIGLENAWVYASGNSAGLISVAENGSTISNCYCKGQINGDLSAGLIFYADYSFIYDSFADVTVNGNNSIGGFASFLEFTTVSRCFSKGSVSSSGNYAGGFAYELNGSTVSDCYSACSVSGNSYIGGFGGYLMFSTISNCYSRGLVTAGGTYTGGFSGRTVTSTVTSCYWDKEASGKTTSSSGTGKTTAEIKLKTTYVNWDYTTPVWKIVDTRIYPFLSWEPSSVLTLVSNPTGGGTLSGGGDYPVGTLVSISSVANSFSQFVNWTDEATNVITTDPGFDFTIAINDTNFTANYQMYFTKNYPPVDGASDGDAEWADFDNDGYLDFLITGQTDSWKTSTIYRNDGSGNFWSSWGFSASQYSASSFGDYDNDGDIDILTTGWDGDGILSRIWRNNINVWGGFDNPINLPHGVNSGSVDWGDFDNDGDLDILQSGYWSGGSQLITKIYKNNGVDFAEYTTSLPGVQYSSNSWGDYDNDGDLDFVLTGSNGSTGISQIYRNDNRVFTDINAGLTGVYFGSAEWRDYDNDGDLDLLIAGYSGNNTAIIYNNNNGVFTDINAGLTGINWGQASWGDFDSDGDLDIALSGNSDSGNITKIYRNTAGSFIDFVPNMTGLSQSSVNWADYDNDGDLDLLTAGYNGSNNVTIIYNNFMNIVNTVPGAPVNPDFAQNGTSLQFSFDPASDTETPSAGLTYNIQIEIGERVFKPGESSLITGARKIPKSGNIGKNTSYAMTFEAGDTALPQEVFNVLYRIQAVDNNFAGSLYTGQVREIYNRDLITIPQDNMSAADELVWEHVISDSLDHYTLQLSDDPLFGTYYEENILLTKDTKTVYIGGSLNEFSFFGDLVDNTTYYWRVKPDHINLAKHTVFKETPDSFIYNQILSAPSNVRITNFEGNFLTLEWNSAGDVEYSLYSSSDPYAAFPAGWFKENSGINGTSCIVRSATTKKFFVVTSTKTLKNSEIQAEVKSK